MLVFRRNRGERAMLFCKGVCIGWVGRHPIDDRKVQLDAVDELTVIREEIMSPEQQAAYAAYEAKRAEQRQRSKVPA